MIPLVPSLLLAFPLGLPLFGVPDGGYEVPDLGLSFQPPADGWSAIGASDVAGGGAQYEYRDERGGEATVGLILWRLETPPPLAELGASELRQMAARGEVRAIATHKRTVAGGPAHGTAYRFVPEDGTPPLLIDATYFHGEGFLGRIAVKVPGNDAEYLSQTVALALSGLHVEEPTPVVVEIPNPDPTRAVTIVHGAPGDELGYAYLESLPGAARLHGGSPIVLAVGPSIDEAARSFLGKYRPGTVRIIGPPHPELPDAREVLDVWPAGGTVVVCERRLAAAIPAACLATRLQVPLLVDRGDLSERAIPLSPSRIVAFGECTISAPGVPVERPRSVADVARRAGGAEYIALVNTVGGEGAAGAAVGAALAAARGGVVLALDMSVVRHRIPLVDSTVCPPGLEGVEGMGHYLTADVESPFGRLRAATVQTTMVNVASRSAPRYGRLRLDLDGDGRFEADEEPRIGSVVEFGGRSLAVTYHYAHPFVPYLTSEVLLDEFDTKAARGEIQALVRELGTVEYLALVGTPTRLPFCYREATGYFEAYDIKQELPTDAPYANLDDDSYLELAVGRLPVEDLVAGSTLVATTLAYAELEGDWVGRGTIIQPGFHEKEGALPWVLPNAEALLRGIEGDLVAAGVEARTFYREDVAIDDVIEAMAGSAWIAYFNHSGPGTWGIHPGSSIVTLPNGRAADRPLPALRGAPVVFGGGCSSAALDVGQPLEATFPGRFFQLGAVAYLGNTRVAFARSEHLVQPFFARLASGEATLGQAYRDGRNLLAHLLEGGHLLGPLDEGVEFGLRDFLWAQYGILNLFGDPALRPRLPDSGHAALAVELSATARPGHLLLTIENHGPDRRDPVQMMPAAGQGSPGEFFVRTGPGLTSSHMPFQFVRDGLSPVRSQAEIQPGAWVDVALPSNYFAAEVSLAEGPVWADRGFTLRTGARGEPRLQMFVPLVRSTLENGDGTVAHRVAFDVVQSPAASFVALDKARVRYEAPWSQVRQGEGEIDEAARDLLAKVRAKYRRPAGADGPGGIHWRMANPQPRLYGNTAHFTGSWNAAGEATVEAHRLPPHLLPRQAVLEEAVREVASLPFACPMPPLSGRNVGVASPGVLVLTCDGPDAGAERIEVHVAIDGTIERIVALAFGLTEETRYVWRDTPHGPILERRTKLDPVRPEKELVHEVRYHQGTGFPRPESVTLRLAGLLPEDLSFAFEYAGPL